MHKWYTSKIGLEQSHTECISPQSSAFRFYLWACVVCSRVALSAGQSRGILRDGFTIYKCGVKEIHPDKQTTPTRLQGYAHRALAGHSWLGARMDTTIGLVRCTSLCRIRAQKGLSMYLSGGEAASAVLRAWVCCVNKFSPHVLLLSHSLSPWRLTTNYFDITGPFGSLGSVSFPLDPHHRFQEWN